MGLEDENAEKQEEEEKGDPNSRLLIAAEDGNLDALMAAIQEGADLAAIDPSNRHNALGMAAIQGNEECLRALLVAGALKEKENKQTALHLAARSGQPHCVRTLLEFKANINAVTAEGWTPLHKAAYYGNEECVRELVGAGCNIGSATNKSFTAVHLAAMTDRAACLEALCELGVDINVATSGGATPAHIAGSWGNLATVKVITTYPLKLREGITPALRVKFKQDLIVNLLSDLLVGPIANLRLQDSDGKRAVEVAAEKRQVKVVEYLTSLEE